MKSNNTSQFLDFKTVKNIRDLGGIRTKNGSFIKYKCLLRSADLSNLSIEELNRLKTEYNLKTVIDFRSSHSYFKKKDKLDESITFKHYFVLDYLEKNQFTMDFGYPYDKFFMKIYEDFATKKKSHKAYRGFFDYLLANDDGAILWHCTSGKDRTGIATILLLKILGCDDETLYAEHEKTNEFAITQLNDYLQKHPSINVIEKNYRECQFIAKRSFLEHFFHIVNKNYGGLDNFISNIIGITNKEKDILKKRYLYK